MKHQFTFKVHILSDLCSSHIQLSRYPGFHLDAESGDIPEFGSYIDFTNTYSYTLPRYSQIRKSQSKPVDTIIQTDSTTKLNKQG